jgi:hypothetical protein
MWLQLSPSSLHFHELYRAIQDLPMLSVKRDPSLDGLQLHSHALGRQVQAKCKTGSVYAWASFILGRSVKPISHKEVFHWNKHGMRLLFSNK